MDMKAEAFIIHAAYRALMLKYHPDKFEGDPQIAECRAREINEAYEVLRDSERRAEYDRTLGRGRHGEPDPDETPPRSDPPSRREWARADNGAAHQPGFASALGGDGAHNVLSGLALVLAAVAGAVWWHQMVATSPAPSASPRPEAPVSASAPQVAAAAPKTAKPEVEDTEPEIGRIQTDGRTLTFFGRDGAPHSIDMGGAIRDATISPGARSVAVAIAGADRDSDRIAIVEAADPQPKELAKLAAWSQDGDPVSISRVRFSLEGGYLYAEISRWPTSNAIVQFSLSRAEGRLVIDGNGLRVMRSGPWRGFLLVSRHQYKPEGGSYDPVFVVRPDGHVQMMVPGTDVDETGAAVARWLSENGWMAS